MFSAEDQQTIRDFWKKRATRGLGRWTTEAQFDFELDFLRTTLFGRQKLLDLGSGDATLSRAWATLESGRSVTCVDFENAYLKLLDPLPHHLTFVNMDARDFVAEGEFDAALVFGLVTHLDSEGEAIVYGNVARSLKSNGIAIVKNQTSDTPYEKVVRKFSNELGSDYVGRYPSVDSQRTQLMAHFSSVRALPYPSEFKRFDDTSDTIFVCVR